MSAASSVRIGVIGTGGRITSVLSNVLKNDPTIQITALCDPDDEAIQACRARLNIPDVAISETAEELSAREDVDWVFIGSWNCFHAAHSISAFEKGKNVFCVKPLALSLEEAHRIREVCEQRSCVFALGLVLRYSPLYRRAKALIDEGRIGQLLSFEFNETLDFNYGGYIHGNWRRFTQHAGSHLLEKCCHDVDLALWLTGEVPARVASFGGRSFFTPENIRHQARIGPSQEGKQAFEGWRDRHNVNPFTSTKDIVDHQVAILEFPSGVRATFHTHCMAGIPERRFYMIGSEGSLRFDAYTGRIELRRVGWNEPLLLEEPITGDGHAGADEPMARELSESMAGLRAPAAGFMEGIQSLAVVEAIDASVRTGKIETVKGLDQR